MEKRIKTRIGALMILGLLLAIAIAMPTFGWSGSPDGWSLNKRNSYTETAVQVNNDGEVGIGTTAPRGALHVRGMEEGQQTLIVEQNQDEDSDPVIVMKNEDGELARITADESANQVRLTVGSTVALRMDDTGKVAIGAATQEGIQLYVEADPTSIESIGIYSVSTSPSIGVGVLGVGTSTGVAGSATGNSGTNVHTGVSGSAGVEDISKENIGVNGFALGGGSNYGVRGHAISEFSHTSYGVYGTAGGNGKAYGGYFERNVGMPDLPTSQLGLESGDLYLYYYGGRYYVCVQP
jgi:hypothetical protein